MRAGRLREGMHDFERAAQAYTDASIPLGEYYTEYADAMTDLRLLPEAAVAAAAAVDELDAAGAPLMVTEAQLRLARIALLTGEAERATALADAAADRGAPPTPSRAGGTGRSWSPPRRGCASERSAPPRRRRLGGPRAGSSARAACTTPSGGT